MALPRVIADGPLAANILEQLVGRVELLPWSVAEQGDAAGADGVYIYGHPNLDGPMMDGLPGLKVISNYGVGVDHIDLAAAAERGIPVGNTPGILDGATADMAFALLLAGARRLAEGDRYARSPEFTVYDPGYMLGREVHHATLGIVGMGRIGAQIARRARGFEMEILYHNRNRRPEAETELGARYADFDTLLKQSDFVVLSTPLTPETQHLMGREEFARMKPTAVLVNIARGGVVDTDALTDALQERLIYAAALDVTEPEPLPRDHPLLQLENVTIAPHLGSATEQTRQQMADNSLRNLFLGLAGEPLAFPL